MSNIKGDIKVGPKNKLVNGSNGKMIWEKNYIKTGENSSTTIFFKDGSEVRLFGKSNLKIGLNKSTTNRWLRYRIHLIFGSFWGYFNRGDNPIEITGDGLRIHVSKASMRFSRYESSHNINANSGVLKVFNSVSSVKLYSGQRLYKVQKKDFLPKKVTSIPNQLNLWIEPKSPFFSNKKSLSINLFLQVVRSGTGIKIKRPGPVFLKSNYYNLVIPRPIRLNIDGKAKIILEAKLPHSNDRTFEGSVIFQTIMDQNNFDDVQDGFLKVKLGLP